jgi:cytochrome c oxidase assembly protein subunit 11
MYMLSVAVGVAGVSYAAVPLYKVFCQVTGGQRAQVWCCYLLRRLSRAATSVSCFLAPPLATGFGGTTQVAEQDKAAKMKPAENGRAIRVRFDGGVSDAMPWSFRQTQNDILVVPGETALAFYTAKNLSKKDITGVATYNVFPLKAGEATEIWVACFLASAAGTC